METYEDHRRSSFETYEDHRRSSVNSVDMWDGRRASTEMSPASVLAYPQAVQQHEQYKTVLCTNYQRTGLCHFGDRCNFAHGPAELRQQQQQWQPPQLQMGPSAWPAQTQAYGSAQAYAAAPQQYSPPPQQQQYYAQPPQMQQMQPALAPLPVPHQQQQQDQAAAHAAEYIRVTQQQPAQGMFAQAIPIQQCGYIKPQVPAAPKSWANVAAVNNPVAAAV